MLRKQAANFITLAVTQRLLDELEQIVPATVRNVVPKPVSLQLLRDVLHRLVEERVCIRDLQAILEALSTMAAAEKSPQLLVEVVRRELSRAITFSVTQGQDSVRIIQLDSTIEDTIRRAIIRDVSGVYLTLTPAAARDIHKSIAQALATLPSGTPTIFLATPDIRRFVWQLIKVEIPEATVISFADLLPTIRLVPIARVTP